MRSIRFSLILYFLLLFGAALGGVSFLCYQSTQEALAAKEKSTQVLLKKKFDEEKTDIFAKFDARVRARVREIGSDMLIYYNRTEPLHVLGAIGTTAFNGGITNLALPLAELAHPVGGWLNRYRSVPRVQGPHPESELYQPAAKDGEFYQVYAPPLAFGPPPKQPGALAPNWPLAHEVSQGDVGAFGWELSKDQKEKADQGQTPIDDSKLKSGQKVRRVTYKATAARIRTGITIPPLPELEKFYKGFPKGGDIGGNPKFKPYVYIQFGIDAAERDKAVATGRENLQADLDKLTDELAASRTELAFKLLWISLGGFAVLVCGGFWLIRVSLKPLDRLSDAVSKVSERDFRLPINQNSLPGELQPIADRLATTLEQLKRVFEREKQAAADISHELRTPVAALITTLDITLRKPRSNEEYREVLVECRDSGKHISQLVERLLTLARLDAGADMLRPRDVDVSALADQCVALVRPLAEAHGLQLNMHHHGPAAVHADPDKLREVLTNLLHNAIEYNKPNGSIEVRVERQNGTLAMEVRDTGIGISPQTQKRIFERFFRADPSRHVDSPHAGLGLAIVKGYVDLMGGSIDVDSIVGAGTTFRVRLPVR